MWRRSWERRNRLTFQPPRLTSGFLPTTLANRVLATKRSPLPYIHHSRRREIVRSLVAPTTLFLLAILCGCGTETTQTPVRKQPAQGGASTPARNETAQGRTSVPTEATAEQPRPRPGPPRWSKTKAPRRPGPRPNKPSKRTTPKKQREPFEASKFSQDLRATQHHRRSSALQDGVRLRGRGHGRLLLARKATTGHPPSHSIGVTWNCLTLPSGRR